MRCLLCACLGCCGGEAVIDDGTLLEGCAAHPSPESCAMDTSCRWLVPGCVASGVPVPPLGEEACHPAQDCTSDGDCEGDARCTEVVIDPCWNDICHACGSNVKLCL